MSLLDQRTGDIMNSNKENEWRGILSNTTCLYQIHSNVFIIPIINKCADVYVNISLDAFIFTSMLGSQMQTANLMIMNAAW